MILLNDHHWEAWSLLAQGEGGKEECFGRGGVVREGRTVRRVWLKLRVATDRLIAAERQPGKVE